MADIAMRYRISTGSEAGQYHRAKAACEGFECSASWVLAERKRQYFVKARAAAFAASEIWEQHSSDLNWGPRNIQMLVSWSRAFSWPPTVRASSNTLA
jgi:hypothetical protein